MKSMSLNKHVYISTPFYYPQINGVSFVAQESVTSLIKLGYNVTVLTNPSGQSIGDERVYGFDLIGNNTLLKPLRGSIEKYKSFLKKIDENSIIICHCWHTPFTNIVLDENLRLKKILYSHGTSFLTGEISIKSIFRVINYFPEIFRFKKRLNRINLLLTLSNERYHHRCHDIRFIDDFKCRFIDNPIPSKFETIECFDLKKTDYFLVLSNFERIKNQLWLLKEIKKNHIQSQFVFLGSNESSYLGKIRRFLIKNPLPNVEIIVSTDQSKVKSLLVNCRALIFPSKNDFSPLTILEAIYFNRFFVSFQTARRHYHCGYYAKNREEFIEMITKISKHIPHTDNNEYIEQYLSRDIYTAKLKTILDEV